MPYTVSVDKDLCISSGRCVADAPGAFRFDDDELAEALPSASDVPDATLLAVGRTCPSGAIRVLAGDGTPLVD